MKNPGASRTPSTWKEPSVKTALHLTCRQTDLQWSLPLRDQDMGSNSSRGLGMQDGQCGLDREANTYFLNRMIKCGALKEKGNGMVHMGIG